MDWFLVRSEISIILNTLVFNHWNNRCTNMVGLGVNIGKQIFYTKLHCGFKEDWKKHAG